MRILLSNDDGVYAPGLQAMYEELQQYGDVWVVAPLEEKSTTGHSLTIHKPLRILNVNKRFFGVSGSPADCVYLGIREIMGKKPDLVVSGINRGANLGQDVYYSGTVSAAREACILGIPALAVSLAVNFKKALPENKLNYATAAKVTVRALGAFSDIRMTRHTLLNLNVPDVPYRKIKGIALARQGFRFYSGSVLKRKDHRGKPYFWVGGQYDGFHPEKGTDCDAVDRGFAALTPIKLDGTDLAFISSLKRDWDLGPS
jgi:5'-nucleotidase